MLEQKSLEQILQVLNHFKSYYSTSRSIDNSYQQAIRKVARDYDVAYQTIGDACRRRLGLTVIGEFSIMLRKWVNGDPTDLIATLKKSSKTYSHSLIEEFFKDTFNTESTRRSNAISNNKAETLVVKLSEKDVRLLKAIAELEGSTSDEILQKIITDSLRNELKQFVNAM